jgi:hypothetical protein
MEIPNSSRSPFATATSWAALCLGLMCVGNMAWYIPATRGNFVEIFKDFGAQLPAITQAMLGIPAAVFPVVAAGLAVAMLMVQWFVSSKGAAAIFHMLVMMLCCVALVAYREVLDQPFFALVHNLSSGPTGR